MGLLHMQPLYREKAGFVKGEAASHKWNQGRRKAMNH